MIHDRTDSVSYPDNGCNLHPHCLECPRPYCKEEEGIGRRGSIIRRRDKRFSQYCEEGLTK